MELWMSFLFFISLVVEECAAHRNRHNQHSHNKKDDDDDDDDKGFWSHISGVVVIAVICFVAAIVFSLCSWIMCSCHDKCRKDRVRNAPGCQMLSGRHSTLLPAWTSRLFYNICLSKGFSKMSDGFYVLNSSHLVRQRSGTAVTDGARWAIPLTTGKHVFEIIWPWGCRGNHATVGLGTQQAPIKGKGGVNLVGGNIHSWGLDIIRRKVLHDNKTIGACPTDGSYVPDRFLMFVDMDEGKAGFGCDVTFWGFVITGLPTGGQKPLYVMAGSDKWQAQFQVNYKGSAESDGLDTYCNGETFALAPLPGIHGIPQPLLPPAYVNKADPPSYSDGVIPTSSSYSNNNNNNVNTNNTDIFMTDWKPEPPPSPTAPNENVMFEPPPPYRSPSPQ